MKHSLTSAPTLIGFAILLSACGDSSSGAGGSAASTTSTGTSSSTGMAIDPNTYVLDFSGSELGGARFGSQENLAFAPDLTNHLRTFSFKAQDPQKAPKLSLSMDGATCPVQPFGPQESHANALEKGDTAVIAYVDLEIAHKAGDPTTSPGSVCFGVRNTSGWGWVSDVFTIAYDAPSDTFRAHITYLGGDLGGAIDGVFLLTDMTSRPLRKVTYVTKTLP